MMDQQTSKTYPPYTTKPILSHIAVFFRTEAEQSFCFRVVEIPGDVNLDGSISVQDVVLLVSHILGNATLEGNAVFAADFNLDATVNIQDVITLVAALLD